MSRTNAPLRRSIGLTGVVRWLGTVAAVIAVGAAFAGGRYAVGIVGAVWVVAAVALGYRARRARQAAGAPVSPHKPL